MYRSQTAMPILGTYNTQHLGFKQTEQKNLNFISLFAFLTIVKIKKVYNADLSVNNNHCFFYNQIFIIAGLSNTCMYVESITQHDAQQVMVQNRREKIGIRKKE